MGAFRIAAAYLLCLTLAAASGNTVRQVQQFVQSAIEHKDPDKEVAQTLRTMKLSERLDAETIEALQKQGAGPRTIAALKELAAASVSLPPAAPPAAQPVHASLPPPSAEEQAKLLAEVRDYAANYTGRLPDFICLEQTRRYVDSTGHEAWRATDVITARLSYFNQHEDYKLISQNDRVITGANYESVGGATSTGDFGTTMQRIFDPKSNTEIEWKRWATLRGRRMHVFSYRIALEFSDFSIRAGHNDHDDKDPEQTVLVGYHGEIFVDREFGAIMRITKEADNIPPSFPVRHAHETLDYDYTKIGDAEFLLPLSVDVRMQTGREWMRNVKEFRLYRKFSAEAVIKFDAEQTPGEQNKEPQPPK
jgi:hypothetical protein